VTAHVAVGTWLALWAVTCAQLARRPLAPHGGLRFAELFVPALAVGMVAVAIREPRIAFAEGSAAVMLAAAGSVDAKTGYLFDSVTLPCAAICSAAAIAGESVPEALLAVLAVSAPLAGLALLSRGAWIGWGDVKASFSLAVAFGPLESPVALLLASLSGLISSHFAGGCLRRIPFGPHLAIGAAMTLAVAPLCHFPEISVR
jgi:prepilin signal peptidase PulO-like enzyme (type II secretory pathway)